MYPHRNNGREDNNAYRRELRTSLTPQLGRATSHGDAGLENEQNAALQGHNNGQMMLPTAHGSQDGNGTLDESNGRLSASSHNRIPAVRRLVKELELMENEAPESTWARPKSLNNLLKWTAKIRGPDGSPYANGIFTLDINFSEEYPFRAPSMRFTTPIFHCNVSAQGLICTNSVEENACWSPGLTLDKMLLSVSAMLHDADPSHPINEGAAQLYLNFREQYDKTAREWTDKHAMNTQWPE